MSLPDLPFIGQTQWGNPLNAAINARYNEFEALTTTGRLSEDALKSTFAHLDGDRLSIDGAPLGPATVGAQPAGDYMPDHPTGAAGLAVLAANLPEDARDALGITGWRNVNSLRMNGWENQSGSVYVRRIGDVVHVQIAGLFAIETTSRTVLQLPSAFRPTRGFAPGAAEYYGAQFVLARVITGGNLQLDNSTQPDAARNAYISYATSAPWPTSLPGTPA